ncbi:monovalent cation/H+ antiporter complex subunit F [Brevibacterium jeotgali]|uniref:Multicomponent Na+:H+ antiporter subunit F n=1 Tax=Brevibacterium jeotgali TaxID=1262550 RepID=A0A2H1L7I0_9MICO|nr:monovalent cation/H+ antiporter complex subunit F [Brevibacterium jeotgali]TWC03099.1 multicomponent Na+:H+ antiporter subunit F [Brevibacterium jeotgali]SMY12842.1 multicomponent Na+:H+ antiporter subunit F [Brevibacterium jeotgali]
MTFVFWTAIAIFAVAIGVGLVRVASAKDLGSRAIIGDLVYFAAIGILTMIAMLTDISIMLDVIFLSSLLGILATIALARILTRGHR